MDRRRAKIMLASLVATFVALRAYLYMSPNTDFDVGPYNVHHLFTGLLLLAVGGIAAVLFPGSSRVLDAATALFGIGLSMALDEWVYLIVTDGTNASYLLPVSFWGGAVMVGLACLYVLALGLIARRTQG